MNAADALSTKVSQERGQVLALFAGGLVVFLALVGLSVDIGRVVYTRTDLQKVADAAALAGAQDLPSTTAATNAAQAYTTNNGGAETISTVSFNQTNTSITVVAARHVEYSFLKFIGLSGADPSARATVQAQAVTGYRFEPGGATPFTVWGGQRTGNPQSCGGLSVCEGQEVVFRSNNWDADNKVTGPNYQLSSGNNPSNKFKGSFNGGGDVHQVDPNAWQTFSHGGNGNIDAPPVGSVIILPIITKAKCTGNCGTIEFTIASWAAVKVTSAGNPSQPWKGILLPAGTITAGGETGGNSQPPSQFVTRTLRMTE
ncbi:MAG: hypothetical protein C0506_06345 [Anaerolinea sp.]|nr:hypothetical protein [Anaerolinea sp.]